MLKLNPTLRLVKTYCGTVLQPSSGRTVDTKISHTPHLMQYHLCIFSLQKPFSVYSGLRMAATGTKESHSCPPSKCGSSSQNPLHHGRVGFLPHSPHNDCKSDGRRLNMEQNPLPKSFHLFFHPPIRITAARLPRFSSLPDGSPVGESSVHFVFRTGQAPVHRVRHVPPSMHQIVIPPRPRSSSSGAIRVPDAKQKSINRGDGRVPSCESFPCEAKSKFRLLTSTDVAPNRAYGCYLMLFIFLFCTMGLSCKRHQTVISLLPPVSHAQ